MALFADFGGNNYTYWDFKINFGFAPLELDFTSPNCLISQYSRLCSTFFNLEHVFSVRNTSTWWPRKRKRSKSFLGVHVRKERSDQSSFTVWVSGDRISFEIPSLKTQTVLDNSDIWPEKVPLVKIIGKLETMKDKHNVLMTCYDW